MKQKQTHSISIFRFLRDIGLQSKRMTRIVSIFCLVFLTGALNGFSVSHTIGHFDFGFYLAIASILSGLYVGGIAIKKGLDRYWGERAKDASQE